MAQPPNDADPLVAKMMAMEVMLLTLVRPVARNPKFWEEVDAVTQAFQNGNPQAMKDYPHRWQGMMDSLAEWRRALTPPAN
jgi:hypothetical protein